MFVIELFERVDTVLSSSYQDSDHVRFAGFALASQFPQSSGYIAFNGVVCASVTCHQ